MTELDTLPLLDGLTPSQRAMIAGISRTEGYAAGTRLFDEGGAADRVWVVLSGCVVVDTAVPGRGRVAVQGIGPGQLLGWSWLVPPYRWHFGATAASATKALVVDAKRLRALADDDPALGYRLSTSLVGALVDRLQATRLRLLDLYRSP